MIPDYNRYYGCVFTQLLESRANLGIEKLNIGVQGAYLLDRSIPLYIKFSRNRKGPWGFNFQRDHQACFGSLVEQFGVCIVAFVCGTDGIVALDNLQLGEVLDDKVDDQEGVTIRRKLRHMYSVSGTNGKLARKVSRDSLILLVNRLTASVSPHAQLELQSEGEIG